MRRYRCSRCGDTVEVSGCRKPPSCPKCGAPKDALVYIKGCL
ncbi:TPA: radical SAM protein [Candidatus Bathyarchaeota archaeon]|nr:radical SAM protein [Candidatus Bathyarchaeota archaeon]